MATLAPSSSNWLDGLPSAGDLGVSHDVRPDTGDLLDAVRSGVASWRSTMAPGCSGPAFIANNLVIEGVFFTDPWIVCDVTHLSYIDWLTWDQLPHALNPPQLCQVATVEDVVCEDQSRFHCIKYHLVIHILLNQGN